MLVELPSPYGNLKTFGQTVTHYFSQQPPQGVLKRKDALTVHPITSRVQSCSPLHSAPRGRPRQGAEAGNPRTAEEYGENGANVLWRGLQEQARDLPTQDSGCPTLTLSLQPIALHAGRFERS